MVEVLISIIIYLLIAGLIWWAVSTILGVIPLPEPIKTVINVLMIVVICLIVGGVSVWPQRPKALDWGLI